MKVITFSTTFPKGHIRAGQETNFVEKTWSGFDIEKMNTLPFPEELNLLLPKQFENYQTLAFEPKLHTIRAGYRWNVGDMASLRVWSDKPYRSKQIEFAQVEIKQVWNFEIIPAFSTVRVSIRDKPLRNDISIKINGKTVAENAFSALEDFGSHTDLHKLAQNDGLTVPDFVSWFGLDKPIIKPFKGQIICWSEGVKY